MKKENTDDETKEKIEIEAMKTTYPLALQKGIKIGKAQQNKEFRDLIGKIPALEIEGKFYIDFDELVKQLESKT